MLWAEAVAVPSASAPTRARGMNARMAVSLSFRAHGPLRVLPPFAFKFTDQAARVAPTDCLHEGFDIAGRLGAEVDMVGVLIHIERQNWRRARQRVAMVRGPLVDQLLVARRPRQQHPPR